MSLPGGTDLMVLARRVLLDALEALSDHREALVLIGAQAVYIQTRGTPVALPETTKDSDLAIDRRRLADDPRLEDAMLRGGFGLSKNPGSWLGPMDPRGSDGARTRLQGFLATMTWQRDAALAGSSQGRVPLVCR